MLPLLSVHTWTGWVPPSASVALAEQVSVSSLVAEVGLMETVPITGSVLVTDAVAVPVPEPPKVSDAVAVQVRVSPGSSVVWMV